MKDSEYVTNYYGQSMKITQEVEMTGNSRGIIRTEKAAWNHKATKLWKAYEEGLAVWKTSQGDPIFVDNMDDAHIFNAHKMLCRSVAKPGKSNPVLLTWIKIFEDVMRVKEIPKPDTFTNSTVSRARKAMEEKKIARKRAYDSWNGSFLDDDEEY